VGSCSVGGWRRDSLEIFARRSQCPVILSGWRVGAKDPQPMHDTRSLGRDPSRPIPPPASKNSQCLQDQNAHSSEAASPPSSGRWPPSPPKKPGEKALDFRSRDEPLLIATHPHREPSPFRRGEKVPKADEGSPSWQVRTLLFLALKRAARGVGPLRMTANASLGVGRRPHCDSALRELAPRQPSTDNRQPPAIWYPPPLCPSSRSLFVMFVSRSATFWNGKGFRFIRTGSSGRIRSRKSWFSRMG